MPTIKLITYNVSNDAARREIIAALETVYGANAVHIQYSCWLVWSSQSVPALWDAIGAQLTDFDRLWVCEVLPSTLACFSERALDGANVTEWIRARGLAATRRAA